MPASRTRPKPQQAHEDSVERLGLGFRVAASGPNTSKTLMFQELETLLAAVPVDAAAEAYKAAIVSEDVLSQHTLSTRKRTSSKLTARHGLDPTKSLFRVQWRLWGVDHATRLQMTSYSQLVCGFRGLWDLLLASAVTPTCAEEG